MRCSHLLLLLACAAGRIACAADDPVAGMPPALDSNVTVSDVSTPGRPGKTFTATTVIHAPVPKLCAILSDYAAYPDFMPHVSKTRVQTATDGSTLVDMTLALPLGKIKKYRLRMTPQSGSRSCRLAWQLVPWEGLEPSETIVDTTGYWQLTTSPSDPSATEVNYFVYTDPGPIPFGFGWIVDLLSRHSLPQTLEAVRKRAGAQ